MRILQVAFKSEITGAEAVLLDLARGCLKAGHEVHAALPEDGPLATALAELGCTCHIVAMSKTYDLPAARRLAKLISRQEIDLVHSHGLLVNLLARLACRMAGRARCVNSVHLTRNLASGGRSDGWPRRWARSMAQSAVMRSKPERSRLSISPATRSRNLAARWSVAIH